MVMKTDKFPQNYPLNKLSKVDKKKLHLLQISDCVLKTETGLALVVKKVSENNGRVLK